ncbi:MAG TPA: HlyD family efflux transporter periplasmic adaptor subunit [Acidimicrobiia bacterium]|nr:HlyD family efflux transporter periplasmic adaptor subunit [Acidimicrobiia bacterium]
MTANRTTSQLPAVPESVLNPTRRGRLGRRLLALLIVVALIAGAGFLVQVDSSEEAGNYRTAAVAAQEIEQTYTGVATIEPVTQAEVTFPTSGTVEGVEVAVGDTVSIGDTLATLDGEQLEETLRQRQAGLAQAELVLAVALDGEDPTSVTSGVLGVSAEETATVLLALYTPEETVTIIAASHLDDDISAAQQAVLDAQQAVDAAMTDASAALDQATLICDAVDVDTVEACRTVLDEVIAAQQAVRDAQTELAAAVATLDALLTEWAEELEDQSSTTTTTTIPDSTTTTTPDTSTTTIPGSTTTTTPGTAPDTGTPPSTGVPSDGGAPDVSIPNDRQPAGGGGNLGGATVETESPSSEDLIAYQSAVNAAILQVEVAEQALAQATIVSPITGAVTSVNIEAGDDITGATDTETIVIEGSGGYEATLMVSINDIAEIEVGQSTTLVADGSTESMAGEVVQVSAVPAEANTTTYRVTVGLDDQTSTLRNGNIGNIGIVTGKAESVIAVPTSAVSLDGTSHTVTVVNTDGTLTTVTVQVGVIGGTWTEITSGDLSIGQQVVLADLDEPLPGSATEVAETGAFQFPGGGPGAILLPNG